MFRKVPTKPDFPLMEKRILNFWYKKGIVKKYLEKNKNSKNKFSFLDGPITANNPMGVHHAWGRTYKDLWQRFFNMLGARQRFQNGFDEQGLWVEVEVEKELGLKSKKDIENLVPADKFASIAKFVSLCKERVKKFSQIQTEQSKRLGYFMDWDNSYHTSSEKNNYAIWHFLKICHKRGYLYKGRDSVPWCPRCGTAISEHEIWEGYQELTHPALYFRLPLKKREKTFLLVWTTTPWTIPANVAVALDSNLKYVEAKINGETYIVEEKSLNRVLPNTKKGKVYPGKDLAGWEYESPFHYLPKVMETFGSYKPRTVVTDPAILPISSEEGTGLVHIAPGAGTEDFALGRKENLPVISLIDETGVYVSGFDWLSGLTTKAANPKIVKELENKGYLFKEEAYTHRYPTCWRCATELVWRVVDEWYIAMDRKESGDKKQRTLRQEMIEVAQKIKWIPKWGQDRELDWLKNMHDWLISKKRYWGLALPIWECKSCGNFEVFGSKEELKDRAVLGWDKFVGHSPHRPWIDEIKIKCSKCGEVISRIPDVGNPWLDAGIVPFSTMPHDWFPADFITESFPGQFKNWFYSLIAMSTVLTSKAPFKTILGYATLLDEKGEPMHKSKGNMIEFNEAAERIGVDVMRWMYLGTNPENNLLFGYHKADEVRRRFYLILWNVFKFFCDYSSSEGWEPKRPLQKFHVLDRWILSRLTITLISVEEKLRSFDAQGASRLLENFIVEDLSSWYVRRIRDRIGPAAPDGPDKEQAYDTLWEILEMLARILTPFVPFIADEMYRSLKKEPSVHLANWPKANTNYIDYRLEEEMAEARRVVEATHAQRKEKKIKVRQPLPSLLTVTPITLSEDVRKIVAEEVNVKSVENKKGKNLQVKLNFKITPQLQAEGQARELVRKIQLLRKQEGFSPADRIIVFTPSWPKVFEEYIKRETLSKEILLGEKLAIKKIG